jgi:DNA-directed RNA polymerase II subunit RPB7
MFFLITLTKSLLLHPSTFGPNLHNEIKKTLYAEVEGKVDPKHGYIIYVSNIFPIPSGEVCVFLCEPDLITLTR